MYLMLICCFVTSFFQLRAKTLLRRNSVLQRYASSLVVAEHDGAVLSAGTLSTITAASKIGGDVSY